MPALEARLLAHAQVIVGQEFQSRPSVLLSEVARHSATGHPGESDGNVTVHTEQLAYAGLLWGPQLCPAEPWEQGLWPPSGIRVTSMSRLAGDCLVICTESLQIPGVPQAWVSWALACLTGKGRGSPVQEEAAGCALQGLGPELGPDFHCLSGLGWPWST